MENRFEGEEKKKTLFSVLHRPGVFRRTYICVFYTFDVCLSGTRSSKDFRCENDIRSRRFFGSDFKIFIQSALFDGEGGGNETKQKPFVSVRKLPLNNASDILYYKCILLLYPCETANGFRFLPTRVCVCIL